MPDTYEIQAPDGSTLELQSDTPPTKDVALRAIRAYGDAQAAKAQKSAEDLSTVGAQLKSRFAKALPAVGAGVLEAINPMTYWRMEQGNVAKSQAIQDALRSGAPIPEEPKGAPIGEQLAALSDPETGGRAIGNLVAGLAIPHIIPKVPPVVEGTGNLITRAGETMNPVYTKRIGQALGGAVGAEMKGLGGAIGGERVGGFLGEMVPPATRATGRLITKAGRLMGSDIQTPTGSPNVKYTPSDETPRPLTQDEVIPPDEGSPNVKYTPPSDEPHNTPGAEPGPPPVEPVRAATGTGSPATGPQPVYWNQYTAPAPEPPPPVPPEYRPTGTGADVSAPGPAGTEPWTAQGPVPSPEPIRTGTGAVVTPPPGAGTDPWTAQRPGEPPPIVPPPTGSGSVVTPPEGAGTEPWRAPAPPPPPVTPPTGTGNAPTGPMPVSWEQFTGRPGVLRTQPVEAPPVEQPPPVTVPPVDETPPASSAPAAPVPEGPAPGGAPVAPVPDTEPVAPDEGRILLETKDQQRARQLEETAPQRAARAKDKAQARRQAITEELQGLVDKTVDAAKRGGWEGDADAETSLREALRQELEARHQFLKENAGTVNEQDTNPQTLLRDVAKGGGISLDQETGQRGEIEWLKEHAEPNGTFNGVRGVVRNQGGLPLDGILEYLQQTGRYGHLNMQNLVQEIANAAKGEKVPPLIQQLVEGTSTDELLNKFGLKTPADDITFDPTEFENESQGRLPGAEGARQVGKPPTMKAPVQASGEDFTLDSRTAAQKAAEEAAAVERAKGPGMFDEPVQDLEAMTRERGELGSADVARERGMKRTEVQDQAPAIESGQTGHTSGMMPSKHHTRIQGKLQDLIDSGASDQELRDHIDYRADGKPTDPKTKAFLITLLRTMGRPVYAATGAAAGGAALRQALVNQLQGDKEQQ